MKIFIIFLAALLVAVWLGATCGHWMDRHVKPREIQVEEMAR